MLSQNSKTIESCVVTAKVYGKYRDFTNVTLVCKDAQQDRSSQGKLQEEDSVNSTTMEDTICKYNQSGFCKFQNNCDKKHDNEICANITICKETQCTKGHPKKCIRFNENGKCFYKEECAYLHDDGASNQSKLNEMMSLCVIKHENEIKELAKNVRRLEEVLNNMTVQIEILVKAFQNIQQASQDNDNENEDLETEAVNSVVFTVRKKSC